jgi:hypothetical protein
VTLRGAHVAPVEFDLGDRVVQPYSLSPWLPSEQQDQDPLLQVLRGDFFCLPFGAQQAGPAHGVIAANTWTVVEERADTLTLRITASDIGATVTKTVSVRDDDTSLYQQFDIEGLSGPYNYGTHPILDMSRCPHGSVELTTSRIRFGAVAPSLFSDPARGEHQVLEIGGTFTSLERVPRQDGGTLDLRHLPTPPGHEDLVMIAPAVGEEYAWNALRFPDHVWFSLRRVEDFPATVLWVSNGGRSQAPWSSRHIGRIGIEDVCSYFAEGFEPSVASPLASQGIATAREFSAGQPVSLRVVQAVAALPAEFGSITDIRDVDGCAVLVDEFGREVPTATRWDYVDAK